MQFLVLKLHISTLTWILLNGNRSSATREHSTHFTASFVHDGFTGACYTILSPSLHSQCAVIVSHKGIAQMLGLPEYVASTASHDHRQLYNDRSLIDTSGVTTSRLKLGASQDSARSRFKNMIILIHQLFTPVEFHNLLSKNITKQG
jgi:hypothetical protein